MWLMKRSVANEPDQEEFFSGLFWAKDKSGRNRIWRRNWVWFKESVQQVGVSDDQVGAVSAIGSGEQLRNMRIAQKPFLSCGDSSETRGPDTSLERGIGGEPRQESRRRREAVIWTSVVEILRYDSVIGSLQWFEAINDDDLVAS